MISTRPGLSRALVAGLDELGRRLAVEVVGIENLPPGRGLLVANHAFGVWDLALAVARIEAATGRCVYSLGEHLWSKVPLVRAIAPSLGIVDGTPEHADELLAAEQLVLVLPGGLREAVKPRELRYRLLWGQRYGFVRAALRNRAPLVPLACVGGDDIFHLAGDAYGRGRRLHLDLPIPRPCHYLPIPHRVTLRFVLGVPVEVEGRGDPEDPAVVRSVRREIEGAIHELLEIELAAREGFVRRP
jgi:1-acyl-sn-glycerol-3-phosphate acyltransferase